MAKTVGVTMFFDLKCLPDASKTLRPVEFYVEKGRVTLALDVPLIIFCDSETRPWLEKIRKESSKAETIYVEKRLIDYDFYTFNHPIIVKNRAVSPHYKSPEERNTPSYCIAQVFKLITMELASRIYPDATHYAWIDLGCSHIADKAAEYLPKLLAKPRPKIACTYIHYRPRKMLEPIQEFIKYGAPCTIATTVFTIQKEYVSLFYTRIMNIFYEALSRGVGHNEEVLMAYLFDRYPDMFSLHYGDYYSCVCNYHYVIRDYPAIKRFFIIETLRNQRQDLTRDCALKVLESVEKGYLHLEQNEINELKSIL